MLNIFKRTQKVKAQDETLQILISFILPDISGDDPADHEANSIGVRDGVLVRKSGAEFIPVEGSAKPSIPVGAADLTINWQTDIVPGTTKTYAVIFGNRPYKALGAGDDGSGLITPYEANISYNLNGNGKPNQVFIQNILYAGTITIL